MSGPKKSGRSRCYADSASYKGVADTFCISPATVRTHLRNVYRKLGVETKTELRSCFDSDFLLDEPT